MGHYGTLVVAGLSDHTVKLSPLTIFNCTEVVLCKDCTVGLNLCPPLDSALLGGLDICTTVATPYRVCSPRHAPFLVVIVYPCRARPEAEHRPRGELMLIIQLADDGQREP